MTWYFDPSGTQMDVYDHTGALVAEARTIATDGNGNATGNWDGQYPNEVLAVMRENMDGDQPSAYNQTLLADAAIGNIVEGTP